ncbi:hypothetical protein [Nocardioides aquaticus]|uniref:hypothetical protein n=1 Tax=Nocardioides aquaticus TaxID=160826 RepID=UPI001BD66D22|nr:hypothetical protein [Nocardioides aquaticus]
MDRLLTPPVGVALILALSSCSGESASSASDPAPTATVTTTVTASPGDASESPQHSMVAKLGDVQPTEWGDVAVLEFNPQVTSDPAAQRSVDQPRWAGALARTCVNEDWDGEPIMLSWGPWSLTDQDDGTYLETGISGGVSYPQPAYPQLGDRTTRPGSCSQGWIVFSAAPGATIAEVAYEGQGLDAPLVWSLD